MRNIYVKMVEESQIKSAIEVTGIYEGCAPHPAGDVMVAIPGYSQSVIKVPNKGTILIDESVPSWDPTHSALLTNARHDYVDVFTGVVDPYDDGCNLSGIVFKFENDSTHSKPEWVFVWYKA